MAEPSAQSNSSRARRLHAWTSAAVATVGLLAFGWSPTELLALYWLENAVAVLTPLVVGCAAVATTSHLTIPQRAAASAVVLVLLIVLGGFIAGQGAIILFLALFEHPAAAELPFGQLPVLPWHATLTPLLASPTFLLGAAAVTVVVLLELRPALMAGWRHRHEPPPRVNAGDRATAQDGADWGSQLSGRLLVTQAALIGGGAFVMLTGLPAASALALVVLKLWFELPRDHRRKPAPVDDASRQPTVEPGKPLR